MRPAHSFPAIAATCLCVLAFAFVQPIFDLLRRYPELLSVHGLEGARLVGFAIGAVGLALEGLWLQHRRVDSRGEL